MHRESPLVSIIIPYNRCDKFFEHALKSITNQSYKNLEILLLDHQMVDKNIDATFTDPRIEVVNCRKLKSLSEVLNCGIQKAHGKYIARMDADDISHKNRIAAQLDFLEANTNIGILGTGIEVLTPEGEIEVRLQPEHHEAILKKMIYNNPFFHPTVMFRRSVLGDNLSPYNRFFNRAQDFELWTRLLFTTQGANLPQALLTYREHPLQSGKKIPYESVCFFRLAQLFLYLNPLKRNELNLNHRYGVRVAKELVINSTKLAMKFLNRRAKTVTRRSRQ